MLNPSPYYDDSRQVFKSIERHKGKHSRRRIQSGIRKIREAETARLNADKFNPIRYALRIVEERDIRDALERRLTYLYQSSGALTSGECVSAMQGIGRSEAYHKRIVRRLRKLGKITPIDREAFCRQLGGVFDLKTPSERRRMIESVAESNGISKDEAYIEYRQLRMRRKVA